MDHHRKVLELDKILDMLAGETAGADAAAAARALQPEYRIERVRYLLQETDDACRLMAGFGAPAFGQLENAKEALDRAASGATLLPRELLQIARLLATVRTVRDWRQHCEGIETVLDDRFAALSPNKYLEQKIGAALLSEEEIADDASPALRDIRRKMRAAAARVREQLDRMIHASATQKFLQEPLVTMRDGRFVIPVKAEHRGEVAGLVHDTSASGATVFVEPMAVVELGNELRVLESREQAEIERILAALSAEVGDFAGGICADHAVLASLDLIFAKARLAYRMKGMCPAVSDDGHLRLCGARHPLLDPQTAVPIDVELGGDFDTLVITGPNTGGKTVTLKTIGLLTLMTMCGLLPPVRDGSCIALFDRILVDIGDEQSIEQSLSTFSAHMTNLIGIIDKSGDGTLVLLDEIGAGTDPVEGAALAVAILEKLRKNGCRVVATTHYAELKAYALGTPGVENGSCEFDVTTLRPTYRLVIGAPGRSNAFAITERLGMDPEVVAHAKGLVSGDDRRLEEIVSTLEERRLALEKQLREAKQEAAAAARSASETQKRLRALEKQQEAVLEDAKAQARRLIEKTCAEAEALQQEIAALHKQKQRGADGLQDAGRRLRARMNKLEDTLDPVVKKAAAPYALPRPLAAGDTVRLADIDKAAVVLSLHGDMAEVQIGVIRTRTPIGNLRLEEHRTPPAPKTSGRTGSGLSARMERSAATDLDLRGMTVEEALLEIDRFLDNAVLAGLERVTLIHGKGTGALRAGVHAHLRTHPQVSAYRLGVFGEGETGVTIAEIRR